MLMKLPRRGAMLVCLLLGFATVASAADTWRAGTARAVITPEKPVWLSGYSGQRVPKGKLHDLWIKVLAIEDAEGNRGVVLTSDLIGFSRVAYADLTKRLKERYQLDHSQVLLTFSHTHSGPILRESLIDYFPLDDPARAAIAEYSRWLEDKIVETVGKALADLAPAELATASGTAAFAVNRRNNPEAKVPEMLANGETLRGPVDHSVPLLVVKSADEKLKAVVFGYACHNTTLNGLDYCGDWAGFAQLAVEKTLPGVQAMFYTGCGADQNPLPRRKVELCEKYGKMLATGVVEALAQPLTPLAPKLRMASEETPLAFEKVLSREEIAPAAQGNDLRGRWAQRLLKRLDGGEKFSATYPYPIHVWKLGEKQLWIVLAGEVVVDFAIRFKAEYGVNTWVAAYTNDMVAYIPSRRVWNEGGYEGRGVYEYGIPAERWSGNVEEHIASTVKKLVGDVGGKP
jgi:hypothetical protein